MKSLKEMKQKGRILRQHLEALFGQPVTLSQAYEALAVSEGFENWNVFSAQLVGARPSAVVPASVEQTPVKTSHRISAIFKTVDGHSKVYFDATAWFEQASYDEIVDLMDEVPRFNANPWEFPNAYGGRDTGSMIVEFFRGQDAGVDEVFAYIKALHDVGGDCGGSDCFFNGPEVDKWVGSMFDARGQRIQEARHNRAYGRMILGLNAETPSLEGQGVGHSKAEVQPVVFAEDAVVGLTERFQVLSVNLLDVLPEHDTPDDVPEWLWIKAKHSFAHKGNGTEDGVWEFMVYVDDEDDALLETVPALLKPFFKEALKVKSPWIMFYQG